MGNELISTLAIVSYILSTLGHECWLHRERCMTKLEAGRLVQVATAVLTFKGDSYTYHGIDEGAGAVAFDTCWAIYDSWSDTLGAEI